MNHVEVLNLITDFFTLDKEVSHEKIPELMEWKREYFQKLQESGCNTCSSSGLRPIYSCKIKKRLYGR